jgi:hypothetical protein
VTSATTLGALIGAAGVAGAVVALRWARWRTSARSSKRARRGFAGQAAAARLLTKAGYVVLDANPRVDWTMLRDGVPHTVELRADYLVQRRGRCYLAEVKTGDAAELVNHMATRRQLLEYQLAFDVEGVLLVCPEPRTIHQIEFAALRAAAPRRWPSTVALLAGAALGWAGAALAGLMGR